MRLSELFSVTNWLYNSTNKTTYMLGAADIFTFPPLNVNWAFKGEWGGGGGKAVDVSVGHFGQK